MTAAYDALNLLVAGEWLSPAGRETRAVVNPATGETIGRLPLASDADLDRALAGAGEAFPAWRKVSAVERGRILRRAADLIRERVKPGAGNRDRLTRPLGSLLLFAHWILSGLDARFGWTPIPLEVQLAGATAYAVSLVFMFWTLRVNRFYSSVVRVQTDRGHHLIDTGPYRFVRHPGYAATLFGVFAGGLALGSWLALLPLVACAALFVRRVLIEEEMLRAELPGYAEYAQRVRSRLIAGLF